MINFANGSEPIVNPWLFYLADVLDGIKILSWVLTGLWLVYVVICFANMLAVLDERDDSFKKWGDRLKKSILPTIASIIFAIIMPSKNILYKMAIAQALTPDNIKIAYDVTGKTAEDILNGGSKLIEDIMDYGVEKINEIRSGSIEEEE